MSRIIVNGSSSLGNQYVIETDNQILLLECGKSLRDILRSIGYRTDKVVGCLVSHAHGDHAKYISSVANKGIKCFGNRDVIDCLNDNGVIVESLKWFNVGEFKVMPFECPHDIPNYGYIIKHKSFGTLFFGTDCWSYPINFTGIDHYLIEANYSDDLLTNLNHSQIDRLMVSHMSLDYCIKYLHDSKAENAQTITLIHLSSRHSNEKEFKKRIQSEFGVATYIADKGLIIDITKI